MHLTQRTQLSKTSQNSAEGSIFTASPSKKKNVSHYNKKGKNNQLPPSLLASSYYAKVVDLTDQENMVLKKNALRD